MNKRLFVQRGFTLIEILVVSSVSIVILVLLSDLFITALRRTQDGRLRVDMQQRALFAINRWERDIEKTSTRAMVVKPGEPTCVSMTPVQSINGSGEVIWKEEIVVYAYQKAARTLQRETYPPQQPPLSTELSSMRPYSPTFTELDSLVGTVSGQEIVLCEDVEEFLLSEEGANGEPKNKGGISGRPETQPLLFHLKLRRTLSTSQRFAEFTIDRRYTLRNNF